MMKSSQTLHRIIPSLSLASLLCMTSFGQTADTTIIEPVKADSAYGWTVHSFSSQLLLGLPDRELTKFPLLAAGISDLNGNLHLRGSRAGEVAYLLDGISVTNPFFNSNGVPLIPEAIERMDIHTGAYGAQFGGANGGIISSRMQRGGENLEFNVNAQADDFASPGNSFIGASPTGYKRVVGTLGGSLFGAGFFVAGQHKYLRNRQPLFLEPFRFDDLTTDQYGSWPQGTPLPGPVEFKRNYLYNNWQRGNTIQGNVFLQIGPVEVQALGSYALEEQTEGGDWPWALDNYYRQARNMINESETLFGALRISSQQLLPATKITLVLSGYDRSARLYDPAFGDDWTLYSDSLAFRQKGLLVPGDSTGFLNRFSGPPAYSTIEFFQFRHPNSPTNNYRKDRQTNYTLAADVSSEILPRWTVTAGGKIEWWTMRKFSVNNISSASSFLYSLIVAEIPLTYEARVQAIRNGSMDFYGYTIDGSETDDGFDTPRTPRFSSLYLNNQITDDQLVLNFGGRYESFFSGSTMFDWYTGKGFNYDLNIFDEGTASQRPSVQLFLPRINASYSAERFSLYTAFGKYAQYAPLDYFLISNVNLSRPISLISRVGYWLNGYLPGFFADPERSTQFELGGRFYLLSNIPFSVRVYYKTLTNQLQLSRIYNEQGVPIFVALVNQGEGLSKGIELSLELLRTNSFTLLTHYTYSDSRGRTSDPFWNRLEVSDQPLTEVPQTHIPSDYDRTHRAVALLHYRYTPQFFAPVDELGLTALLTVQSGHRYTKLQEIGILGSAGPWLIGVRPLLDSRTANPEEPYNNSRTPMYVNLDLRASVAFAISGVQTEFFITILNVFNTKQVLNVFPTTGSPTDDSWFASQYSAGFRGIPLYTEFYSTINLKNGWAYSRATGNTLYDEPMQIRAGITIEM